MATVNTKIRFDADTARAQAQVRAFGSSMASLRNTVAKATAAFFAMRGAMQFLQGSVELAMANERAYSLLRHSVTKAGYSWDELGKSLQAFTDQMQSMTGVADEEFAKATGFFLDVTHDMATSIRAVRLAYDLAITKGEDFTAISRFLAESFANSTTSLKKWGVEIDQTLPKQVQIQEALKQINDQVGGAALKNMQDMVVQVGALAQKWGDLREQIGKLLEGPLIPIIMHLSDMLTVVNELQSPLQKLAVILRFFISGMDPAAALEFQIQMAGLRAEIDANKQAMIEVAESQQSNAEEFFRNGQNIIMKEQKVRGDATVAFIDGFRRQESALEKYRRHHDIVYGSMQKVAVEFANKRISLMQMVAKQGLMIVANEVSEELEYRAKLWAAKAIAAAADLQFARAAGYTAAAMMAVGAAAAVRSWAESRWATEQEQMETAAMTAGGIETRTRAGRTIVSQGPITLNYTATMVIHGNVMGIDALYEYWNDWNEKQLRAAGFDAVERARG